MFFLYHKASRPTGKVLAQALGLPFGMGIQRAQRRGTDLSQVLRWGNAMAMPSRMEIQVARAIAKASDKVAAFTAMQEAGVRIPEFTTIGAHARGWLIAGDTVLGRTRHGARGAGITVYRNPYDFMLGHEFYVKHVPNKREYRLHVVGETVVRVQGKYLDFPEQADGEYIKNYSHGYRFRTPRLELKPDRKEQAVNAVKALGLDFGAVDLVIGGDDLAYVLEVNTAPSCSPKTARGYVEALVELIAERTGKQITPNYEALQALGHVEEDTEVPR